MLQYCQEIRARLFSVAHCKRTVHIIGQTSMSHVGSLVFVREIDGAFMTFRGFCLVPPRT